VGEKTFTKTNLPIFAFYIVQTVKIGGKELDFIEKMKENMKKFAISLAKNNLLCYNCSVI
jgi:hypothetical protein